MRTQPHSGRSARLTAGLTVAILAGLAGCASTPPSQDPSPTASLPQTDRDRLAGLAAAAQGNAFVATYALTTKGRADRTVTVAVGTDGSWVVALPATGLSGLADIAIYSAKDGLYDCLLGRADGAEGERPDLGELTPGCVKVSALTAATDPRVQHLFSDWLPPLTDRAVALSVKSAPAPAGVNGACYSVESTSAALAPPVDPGTYCFDPDGLLTGATVPAGTLKLMTGPAAAPPSVTRPAPVVDRAPTPLVAPPKPPEPTQNPSPSGSPTPQT